MTTRENNILRLCEMNVMTSVDISHHVSKNPSAPVDYIMESTCLLNSNSSPYASVHGYTFDVSPNNHHRNNATATATSSTIVPTQIIQIDDFYDVNLARSALERSTAPGSSSSSSTTTATVGSLPYTQRIAISRIDCDPDYNVKDGKKIVDNDVITTALSNQVGLQAQNALNKNIKKSSVTDKMDNYMLGAVDPMVIPTAYPTEVSRNEADLINGKKDATIATKPTGYQFSEYKSIYESDCGKLSYDMPEYKSIYD
jgi:hypothetical protein